MKVFVYTKDKESKKQVVLTDVEKVEEHKDRNKIIFYSKSLGAVEFDMKSVKTTTFQN